MEIKTTTVFLNNWKSKKKININRGWTRSWKTYNLLELFHFWLLFGRVDEDKYFESWVLSVVRKYSSTLKATAIRDFEDIIDKHNTRNKIEINKADRTYKFGKRTVEFLWADDQQKLRWGKRDILYCNEANELWYRNEFFQLLVRTKYKIFLDFNPDDEYIWINTEIEKKRRIKEKDVRVIISTYKDNPYLSETEIKEIERLEKSDPAYWNIYGLGNYGKLEGLIYQFEEIREIPKEANFLWYWLDFWFTNDPTALIEVWESWDDIIANESIYETGLTNQDIVWKLKELNIIKTIDIYADSSEPKSIEEIYREGYNIKPVTKWPDSIKFWIDILKQYNLKITEKSSNLKKEARKYMWKKDKEGKALNVPIDMYNHWLDALRYIVMMKKKKQMDFTLDFI